MDAEGDHENKNFIPYIKDELEAPPPITSSGRFNKWVLILILGIR